MTSLIMRVLYFYVYISLIELIYSLDLFLIDRKEIQLLLFLGKKAEMEALTGDWYFKWLDI
jgi:hypothetical protein